MGSPPRIEEIGAVYHVNTVAVAGLKVFPNYFHRDVFMRMFGLELELSGWRCLGYTVLGTLGSNKKRARARLRMFVEERDPRVRRRWFLRGTSEAKT
jgi:hypothetical protein